MSTAEFKDYFSKLAAQYAAFRPQYPAELFDSIAALCARRECAWDCACGSGQASAALAERFERVIATDASAKQIAAATPCPNVEYRVAPAESSGIAASSVDLVTVAQALHWFDLERFYAETDRVLRPDGILAVWGYGVLSVDGGELNRLALQLHNDILGPYWTPERHIVEGGYRSLPFPFTELTLPAMQLTVRWPLERLLGYFRSWSSTGRYVAQHGVDPVEPIAAEMARHWGDPQTPREIRWPLALRASRKPR